MKTIVQYKKGPGSFRLEEVPVPEPAGGEVRIGVCDTYAESGSNDELAEKYGFGLGTMKRDCLDLLEKCE